VAPANGTNVNERKNRMARAQLLQALSKDILMQVSTKPIVKEVWDNLKMRFVGADHVKAACLATLKGEFDKLIMEVTEPLDDYAGKISGMAVRYVELGATLDNTSMVKKLLDTVPNRLYPAIAGIEQFYDVATMPFEEALSRLRAFDERSRRRGQAGRERRDDQLLLTAAEWQARQKSKSSMGRCFNCGIHDHFAQDCRKPKKEEALLANADEESALL
jgi:hypothetical protein